MRPVEEYIECLRDKHLQGTCYLRIASDLFKEAIVNLDNTSYKVALDALHECYRPIEEAKRLTGAYVFRIK